MRAPECILLSSLLNTESVLAARGHGITPGHFRGYRREYQWMLDYVETYGTEPSWDAFLAEYPDFKASDHADVRSAADMVLKSYGKAELTTAITEAMSLLGMGDLNEAYARIVKAEPVRTSARPKKLLTDLSFLDDWDREQFAMDTPYRTLNRHSGGMRPGQLWYLAARPKQGKSAHLVNIVTRAVLDGNKVKFFSLEMSEAEVRARFHACLARINNVRGITLSKIRDRSVDTHAYKGFVSELQDQIENSGGALDIHTPADGLVTPGVIAASAEQYHLNVVDYIGLMRSDAGTRAVDDWRNLAGISNDLKIIAASQRTTVLAASQINREGEHGKEPPKLVNLAGSDALGQDGDLVITLRAMAHNVATAFSIEGNRHGPSGKFFTHFDPDTGHYAEITRDEAEDLAVSMEEQ